jgi:uncharacterized protein YacL
VALQVAAQGDDLPDVVTVAEQAQQREVERAESPRIPSDVYVEVVRVLIVAMTTAVGDSVGGGPFAALGACCGYVIGGLLGRLLRRATAAFEAHVQRTPAVTLVAGAVGATAAALVGSIVGISAVVLLPGRWGYPVLAIAAWTGVCLGFQVGARKGTELWHLFRHDSILGDAGPSGLVLVDSSAAMDGRLLTLARSGFLPGALAVPRFVLDELQGLSDSADATRRRRARRGLEVLEVLRVDGPGLVVLPDEVPERAEVDAKLVALAARRHASILTADRGLTGVAGVEGVRALDVVALAETLRPDMVPGEIVPIRLTREGRDPGQAVGFLDDGTMVVVHDAVGRLGDAVEVEITSSVPTSKGRLYFATLTG